MGRLSMLLVPAIAALVATGRPARADGDAPCVLPQYTITAVEPHREDVLAIKVPVQRVRGAEISVQAERGLTAEWLRLQIERHRASARGSSPDCVLDVPHSDVRVDARGAGYVVTVRAKDDDTGAEILRRARTLRPR